MTVVSNLPLLDNCSFEYYDGNLYITLTALAWMFPSLSNNAGEQFSQMAIQYVIHGMTVLYLFFNFLWKTSHPFMSPTFLEKFCKLVLLVHTVRVSGL